MVDEAYLAWCWYYYRTEEVDRRYPGRWSPFDADVWIVDCHHRRLPNEYARRCRLVLAARASVSSDRRARDDAQRLRQEELSRVLAGHPELVARLDAELERVGTGDLF